MPKGYVILTEDIKDPEGMKAYGTALAVSRMTGVSPLRSRSPVADTDGPPRECRVRSPA
jgi:hypothetical protein